jgi:hypothetical protein
MSDQSSQKRWPLRLLFIGLGSALSTIGIFGLKNGILWIPRINQRFGRVAFTPTATFLVFGLIILLIGVIPWGRPERDTKRKRGR